MRSESLAQLRGETQTLFCQASLDDWLASLRENCKKQVLAVSEKTLLSADADAWAQQLAVQFAVEPLVVHADRAEAEDCGEVDVDVRHDQMRTITDSSRPALVPGRKVVVHIPFSGNEKLLRVRPSQFSMNPPRAAIAEGKVSLTFEYPYDGRPAIKPATDRLIADIERHASWQQADLERHNRELAPFARRVIEHRRQRAIAEHTHLDGLGIPVRRAADAPRTYAAPGITRRPSPAIRASVPARAVPMHPTLVGDFYDHILRVVGAMARGMERTPGNYASWSEEQLRDALLVLLNTHYEGQATGETFNKSGKTDIIVRAEDRNVFVGECKWWSGAAEFATAGRDEPSALEQLLAYTTWRDAKLALVVFVGRKNMNRVLESARDAIADHPAFAHWTADAPEGELRCRVVMPGHDDRHAELSVVFVHLPEGTGDAG